MEIKERLIKWAKILNEAKLEYGDDLSRFQDGMKTDGIIAAYGNSDNLLEFRGAYDNELGAWDGTIVKIGINNEGEVSAFSECEREKRRKEFCKHIFSMKRVVAIWCPQNEKHKVWASWHITAPDINHGACFDIWEDGELNCRGLLFTVDELRR
ncbi:MAG: hypothetical protein LBT00_08585 [Spirochaetaceae bacterium]|jgi:hypothetical protein|nr:hypothetical protein [Spirochaetaceae bacterium]